MKKSILLSAVLVCTSALAFAQTENKQASPYTKPAKAPAPAKTEVPVGKKAPVATKATSTAATKGNVWTKTTVTKTSSAKSNTPESLTGPKPGTKSTKKGGAQPTTGNRWTGGKAQGPVAKKTVTNNPTTITTTSDKK